MTDRTQDDTQGVECADHRKCDHRAEERPTDGDRIRRRRSYALLHRTEAGSEHRSA